MANKPNYIPEGYRAITPYLIVRGGAKAIDYTPRCLARRN